MAYPLAIIFQQSIDQSRVPQQWRTANIIPIFKKGSKRDAANYRPISLTSHIGKLLERIIRDHILRHLDNKQLIKPSQHGFLPGRSCQSNLLEFLERVTDDTDRGNNTDVAYLDFAKAFDKVPHARVLVKLKALGVNNQVSSWIEAWLRDRRQRVVVSGEESAWSAVSSGVPQGSILGTLLATTDWRKWKRKRTWECLSTKHYQSATTTLCLFYVHHVYVSSKYLSGDVCFVLMLCA